MNTAPARLLKMPLTVKGWQQLVMVRVMVPLLFHVRLMPRISVGPVPVRLTVEPAAVVRIAAADASSVPALQLKVPALGIAIAPEPVSVPPESVNA